MIFASILEYYRTGVLVKPVGVTDAQFYTELEYFNVPMDGGRHRVYMWGRGEDMRACDDWCHRNQHLITLILVLVLHGHS